MALTDLRAGVALAASVVTRPEGRVGEGRRGNGERRDREGCGDILAPSHVTSSLRLSCRGRLSEVSRCPRPAGACGAGSRGPSAPVSPPSACAPVHRFLPSMGSLEANLPRTPLWKPKPRRLGQAGSSACGGAGRELG